MKFDLGPHYRNLVSLKSYPNSVQMAFRNVVVSETCLFKKKKKKIPIRHCKLNLSVFNSLFLC